MIYNDNNNSNDNTITNVNNNLASLQQAVGKRLASGEGMTLKHKQAFMYQFKHYFNNLRFRTRTAHSMVI